MRTHSHGGLRGEKYLVKVQKSKMRKESEGSSRAFRQGWSNYGCSSELRMIQRLLAEPFALHVHGVHALMPFVVRKSAFRLLSNTQERLTGGDKVVCSPIERLEGWRRCLSVLPGNRAHRTTISLSAGN